MNDKIKRILVFDVLLPLLFVIVVMTFFVIIKLNKGTDGVIINESIINESFNEEDAVHDLNRRKLGVMINDMNITPQIDFFMTAFDTDSNLIEYELYPVYQLLKDNVTFYPRYMMYVGNHSYCENGFCSSMGVQELHQGVRELCAYYYLGPAEYFDFAVATNLLCEYDNADDCWMSAADLAKVDVEEISRCFREENLSIMKDERNVARGFNLINAAVFINGKPYLGVINQVEFFEALCAEFSPDKPVVCESDYVKQ